MGGKEYPPVIKKLLTAAAPPSLGDWFAVPLCMDQAEHLLTEARQAMQRAYARGNAGYEMRILELIACYWLDRPVDHLYTSLSAALDEQHHQALLELVYGQLLMSRRQAAAMSHLDTGFKLAAGLLEPDVYFEMIRRHDMLRSLHAAKRSVPLARIWASGPCCCNREQASATLPGAQ